MLRHLQGMESIGMKVINRYTKRSQDDQLKSKAMDIEKHNAYRLIIRGGTSFMLNSTPLWPISEKKEGINHSQSIKNVCSTLPAFIHKNSRQGEELPAKGKLFGFHGQGFTCKPIGHDDRLFLFKCNGGSRQKPTEISLPRCRIMVGYRNPKRPHFFFGGFKTIIFCLYQLAFLYWQNREGSSPCLS
jgi:hypothetical protein